MKNKIKEILGKLSNWKLFIFAILIVGGAFYWYEIRPSIIYESCSQKARELTGELMEESGTSNGYRELYDFSYKICLRGKGFK